MSNVSHVASVQQNSFMFHKALFGQLLCRARHIRHSEGPPTETNRERCSAEEGSALSVFANIAPRCALVM